MINPELVMWQNVIIRALLDAKWTPPVDRVQSDSATQDTNERAKIAREADAWFRRGGKYFREVCSHAGFDPDFIHEAYTSGRIDIAQLRASEETKRARRAA